MIKKKLNDLFVEKNIIDNKLNKNVIKCLLKTLKKNNLAEIQGQYYVLDEEKFDYLLNIYNLLSNYFDFYYSLKSDLIYMFDYLLDIKDNNRKLSFNAFFCPGYNDKGGYKDHLGNTTTSKLKILYELSKIFKENNINSEINCYYCDSYIENCDFNVNEKWDKELEYNRHLFDIEAKQYFEEKNIIHISDLDIFKDEEDLGGHIDLDIINKVDSKVYNSFYITNETFYNKLNFSPNKIKERNDILVTMYILVSDYINNINNGIYLPMENMYDREKLIANNGTCTMYLKQGMVINNEK